MLDIENIVFELGLGFFDGRTVLILHLRPSGDSRTHGVAQDIVGGGFLELPAKEWAFGTRPDQAHLTAEDIENLRQFIQASLADEPSNFGDAVVIVRSPGGAVCLGILIHGSELEDLERLTGQTSALLPKQNR